MTRRFIIAVVLITSTLLGYGQGFYNHIWLLGSYNQLIDPKGRIEFDSASYFHTVEYRKMTFKGTEATICDAQGNFKMSSNGIWIANANNDTMLNGAGLNPSGITSSWPYGLPMISNALFLPFCGDSNKYMLIHHTGELLGNALVTSELLRSVIDLSQDSSRGEVIVKNEVIMSDTLTWGIGACKHANGRDWWIIMLKNGTNTIFKLLVTPYGTTLYSQTLPNCLFAWESSTQIPFNLNGDKFCYGVYDTTNQNSFLILADFDRCNGIITNDTMIQLTYHSFLWGEAFSPSGKYAYACSSNHIFQIETDSFTVDTVATYDGYISPPNLTCCATTFWNMYLAANGKIYITSGSGVQHLHEMNYPDSAGVACDVQQHSINLGYAQLRAVPNHPNYNLGPVVGSVCDTLGVGLPEMQHDFHFGISPNPVADGPVKIIYLLPENKSGVFEMYNITGQLVYKVNLPPWSTLQYVDLPSLSEGVYTAVVRSGYERSAKKLIVMN